ncbi:MAG TPA: alpha/beta hydrolase [Polyangium sp.]|nr:alpha/beta hydrolase [Polyangium sp.]
MSTLPAEVLDWQSRGSRTQVFNRDVFVLEEGKEHEEALLILHGFPTSSFDFHRVVPHFAKRFRVVVHDHVGFGLSDKPSDYSYSLLEQAEVAMEVWRKLGIKKGHLLAHDYGTSVSTEVLARREKGACPVELQTVTLANGSVFIELAHLSPSQVLLRNKVVGPLFASLSSRRIFQAQLRRIFGTPDSVSKEELDAAWDLLEHDNGKYVLPAISSYLDERTRFRERWIGALRRLDIPAHVCWGRRDPIAVPAIAEKLATTITGARLTWIEELGHYPMLENPTQWAENILSFYK